MINLKTTFGKRYRITLDESVEIDGQSKADRAWLERVHCKYGHIYIHGREILGAYCDRPRVFARLEALPGVTVHQRGDTEMSVTFQPEYAEQVIQLLRPYRRRVVSEEEKARLAALSATHGFRKSNQTVGA